MFCEMSWEAAGKLLDRIKALSISNKKKDFDISFRFLPMVDGLRYVLRVPILTSHMPTGKSGVTEEFLPRTLGISRSLNPGETWRKINRRDGNLGNFLGQKPRDTLVG